MRLTRIFNLVSSRLEDEPWMRGAACHDPNVDPEIFFAADPISDTDYAFARDEPRYTSNRSRRAALDAMIRDAKEICATCPVREECLRFSLERRERFGIYAGLTPRERWRFLKHGILPLDGVA